MLMDRHTDRLIGMTIAQPVELKKEYRNIPITIKVTLTQVITVIIMLKFKKKVPNNGNREPA